MRLIDADALKERYYERMKELLKATGAAEISDNAISLLCGSSLIIDAPTIEAEPVRRGKWIKKQSIVLGEYYECSLCNDIEQRIAPGWWEAKNICPNCGAKMDSEVE